MARIYFLVAIDFRPYLTGIREYVHLSIWHPYFNSGGSRFFQYQVTAASEDDRIKRGKTSVDNAAFRFPLSAARVQGQLAGLNRQEVVDNPHCLIAIRRVQPPAADRQRRDGVKRVLPPTTGAGPHLCECIHWLTQPVACLHRPWSTPNNVAQRLKTIEAPRLHSRRFGSLWKNPGSNIERYRCNTGLRPRKCSVSTIAPAPRWVWAGLAALTLGPFRRLLSATRSLGSTSRYSLLRLEVAKPRRCRILEASQGWPYGRRSSRST